MNDGVFAKQPGAFVVGGGVAGLSTAIELAERGIDVTLFEGAEVLGGKVHGWRDAEGRSLEHGLHGWWLEYTNFRDLLQRVGIIGNLTKPVGPFTIIHPDGTIDRLAFGNLPSPFHVLGALFGLKSVGLRGKLSTFRAGLAVAAFDPRDEYEALDRIDFHTWMRSKGVSTDAGRAMFESTLRSNLFLPTEQISAAAGINAIQRGLCRRDSWRFSWLRGNTNDYLFRPLAEYLEKCGGKIRLSTKITGLQLSGNRITSITASTSGRAPEQLPAPDHVVLALDIESCKAVIRESLIDLPFFRQIFNLSTSDVLVTRTWFQGDVELSHHEGMLMDARIVDAFIDVTNLQPELRKPGIIVIETQSYLGRPWMNTSQDLIRELVLRDLVNALPELERTDVLKTIVLPHPGLFTAFSMGFETSRPTPETPMANLYLAGDWVRAPEPVMFMENAVVTGRHAASAILRNENRPPVPIIPLPPPDLPIRILQTAGRKLRDFKRRVQRAIGFEEISR